MFDVETPPDTSKLAGSPAVAPKLGKVKPPPLEGVTACEDVAKGLPEVPPNGELEIPPPKLILLTGLKAFCRLFVVVTFVVVVVPPPPPSNPNANDKGSNGILFQQLICEKNA